MNPELLTIEIDGDRDVYDPGDQITGTVVLQRELAAETAALETSLIWRTEGKGDEDFGVWFFDRLTPEAPPTAALRRRFSAAMPPSPLSYEGFLVKIRWCVRASVFRAQGKPVQVESPIVLVGRRAVRPRDERVDAVWGGRVLISRPESNPFSASRIRPGAIEYLFPGDESVESLLARWRASGRRGAIVGPHGAGKSTLLRSLRRRLAELGERSLLLRIRPGRVRGARLRIAAPSRRRRVLILDGWEALPFSLRRRIARRSTEGGLLATTHGPTPLPTLWCAEATAESARQVIARLAPNWSERPSTSELAAMLARRDGDLREVLFELYDRWELAHAHGGRPKRLVAAAGASFERADLV